MRSPTRSITLAAALAAASALASAAIAAPTTSVPAGAPVSTAPPKFLVDAGYSHPDITPGMCANISAKETRCTVPGMTAGVYYVVASGVSTATAAGAVQAVDVRLGNAVCAQGQSKNTGQGAKPWATGTPQTIRVGCVLNVLTDHELSVRATYADQNATSDPKGPTLSLRRLPWPGVLSMSGAGGDTEQPKAQ